MSRGWRGNAVNVAQINKHMQFYSILKKWVEKAIGKNCMYFGDQYCNRRIETIRLYAVIHLVSTVGTGPVAGF
jgi:hypothetical protein